MDITIIISKIVALIPALLQIVGGCAILATLTANEVDNKVINWILKIINLIGANIGKAKNA